ncbi:hypothetical protein LCGC14_2403540 [marine sediment metagenome]|uniref:Uncharacterized protein n=1 Tax=marine sediment metagenome TaxID=412755 RepID=A0A0F9BUK9_9ZZZZ
MEYEFEEDYKLAFSDLQEIPFRYRDGSVHYYHPETKQLYSWGCLDANQGWYHPSESYSVRIIERYLHPEEYAEKVRQQNEETRRAVAEIHEQEGKYLEELKQRRILEDCSMYIPTSQLPLEAPTGEFRQFGDEPQALRAQAETGSSFVVHVGVYRN